MNHPRLNRKPARAFAFAASIIAAPRPFAHIRHI